MLLQKWACKCVKKLELLVSDTSGRVMQRSNLIKETRMPLSRRMSNNPREGEYMA